MTTYILIGWIVFLHGLVIYSAKALYTTTKQRDFYLELSIKIAQDIADSCDVVDRSGFLSQRLSMRNKEIDEFSGV